MALAVALNVSPLDLILPANTDELALITGARHAIPASDLWAWARGRQALDSELDEEVTHEKKVLRLKRVLQEARKTVFREERRLRELTEKLSAERLSSPSSFASVVSGRSKWDIEREIEACRDQLAEAELRCNDAEADLEALNTRGQKWQR